MLFLFVIWDIYYGVFVPTEASAVALAAKLFSNFIEISRMPANLLDWVETMNLAPTSAMWTIRGINLVLGCVFVGPALILLTVPPLAPLVELLGFAPIWFGIVVVVVTEISMVIPPIGINAFVLKSVRPTLSLSEIFRRIAPFWIADIARLLVIVLYPPVVLCRPSVMG